MVTDLSHRRSRSSSQTARRKADSEKLADIASIRPGKRRSRK